MNSRADLIGNLSFDRRSGLRVDCSAEQNNDRGRNRNSSNAGVSENLPSCVRQNNCGRRILLHTATETGTTFCRLTGRDREYHGSTLAEPLECLHPLLVSWLKTLRYEDSFANSIG